MRFGRRMASVTLAVAFGTAAAVGLSGPAYASVNDTGEYYHIEGWNDSKCLYDNPSSNALEVYSCHNSSEEQWSFVQYSPDHSQIVNHATGLCLTPGGTVENSTAILLEACDANNPAQYWDEEFQDGSTHFSQFRNAAAHDYCMDRPTQADYDGEHMQLWKCQGLAEFPDFDNHYEQDASETQHVD